MLRYKNKDDESGYRKTNIILGQNHSVRRQMRWRERLFECPVKQMKVNGDDQSAEYDPLGEIEWQSH